MRYETVVHGREKLVRTVAQDVPREPAGKRQDHGHCAPWWQGWTYWPSHPEGLILIGRILYRSEKSAAAHARGESKVCLGYGGYPSTSHLRTEEIVGIVPKPEDLGFTATRYRPMERWRENHWETQWFGELAGAVAWASEPKELPAGHDWPDWYSREEYRRNCAAASAQVFFGCHDGGWHGGLTWCSGNPPEQATQEKFGYREWPQALATAEWDLRATD